MERSVDMENERAVRKSSLYIGIWVSALSILLQSIFLLLGRWSLPVLFGNLLSGGIAWLNFWLMCRSIVKAAALEDDKERRRRAEVSRAYRFLMIVAVLAAGMLLPQFFSLWTLVIPIFFPRIAMLFLPLFQKQLD